MAIPMCEGQRHIFIVGCELCRCGQERSLALDPRETRISILVVKETWKTVEVIFWPRPDGDGIEAHSHCGRCGKPFFPGVAITAKAWKRMATQSRESREMQEELAADLARAANENPCGCRVASLWDKQGSKWLLS